MKEVAKTAKARNVRELSEAELKAVFGGLNPQPLPPRWKGGW